MDPDFRIAIVDYDCGNLFSIQRALHELGIKSFITKNADEILASDKVILPGVGAFGDGMNSLRKQGLEDAVKKFAFSGKPLLGICLGMQLLMEESSEFGQHKGLGIVPGKVVRLQEKCHNGQRIKVPHIGWNDINFNISNPLFNGLNSGTYVYFLHSFCVSASDTDYYVAKSAYGDNEFCAVIQKERIIGMQFHPEISGPAGLRLLENFIFNI